MKIKTSELLKQQLLIKKGCGIYMIYNLQTEKCYIGSTRSFMDRFANHRNALNKNNHGNDHLQKSWNKYTKYSFLFAPIEIVEVEKLEEREQYYLDNIDPEFLYNMQKSSNAKEKISNGDRHYSPTLDAKRKTSKSRRSLSEEGRANYSLARAGKIVPEDTRKKMKESINDALANPITEELAKEVYNESITTNKTYQELAIKFNISKSHF